MSLKKTPLYEGHKKLGAQMVPFASWEMPIQYTGIRLEHEAVRKRVGLFDVSHMGELRVQGSKAEKTLQWLTTNDVSKLVPGKAQYTLLTNHEGGIVDDVIIYCLNRPDDYLLCVNAVNIEKDFLWIEEHNRGANITNESEKWAQIAIQGPLALDLLSELWDESIKTLKPFCWKTYSFNGCDVMFARTGYTGEPGGEVFVPSEKALELWEVLMLRGREFGVSPVGLGARDTLRIEMKYSLYGQDITERTNPIEAGLGWVIKWNAGDFIGKDRLALIKEKGPERKLVGFRLLERGLARPGYSLLSLDNKEIGSVTSATHSPSLNAAIGMGYMPSALSVVGTEFFVDIRGRKARAKVVKSPFHTIN